MSPNCTVIYTCESYILLQHMFMCKFSDELSCKLQKLFVWPIRSPPCSVNTHFYRKKSQQVSITEHRAQQVVYTSVTSAAAAWGGTSVSVNLGEFLCAAFTWTRSVKTTPALNTWILHQQPWTTIHSVNSNSNTIHQPGEHTGAPSQANAHKVTCAHQHLTFTLHSSEKVQSRKSLHGLESGSRTRGLSHRSPLHSPACVLPDTPRWGDTGSRWDPRSLSLCAPWTSPSSGGGEAAHTDTHRQETVRWCFQNKSGISKGFYRHWGKILEVI